MNEIRQMEIHIGLDFLMVRHGDESHGISAISAGEHPSFVTFVICFESVIRSSNVNITL